MQTKVHFYLNSDKKNGCKISQFQNDERIFNVTELRNFKAKKFYIMRKGNQTPEPPNH